MHESYKETSDAKGTYFERTQSRCTQRVERKNADQFNPPPQIIYVIKEGDCIRPAGIDLTNAQITSLKASGLVVMRWNDDVIM